MPGTFTLVQSLKRVLWFLNKALPFSEMEEELLVQLAEQLELRHIKRREVIYLPGDPGDTVYLVNEGRVKISKVTRDGKALTLSYCKPSELFGETCIVDGAPREEMVEAMEDSLITELHRTVFDNLLAHNIGFAHQMTKLLAKRRLDLENKLETLVFRDVTSKLAELLLDLANEYGVEESRGTLIALKITHQELANLIGSTRETVSLTLSQFKQQDMLTTDGRKVIVTNSESLRALY